MRVGFAAGASTHVRLRSLVVNIAVSSVVLASVTGIAVAVASPGDDASFKQQVAPLLQHSCVECHSGEEPEASQDFAAFMDGSRKLDDASVWRRMRDQLRAGNMPPKKKARPAKGEVDGALAWIDAKLAELRAAHPIDPGAVTLRRLNRVEYENTVRDLVGVEFDAQALFPSDDIGYGFDNIGDVLSMSDGLLEKYVVAAERIAREAIVVADPRHPPEQVIAADHISGSHGIEQRGGTWSLYANGDIETEVEVAHAGDYLLRARAWAQQAGPDPARMELKLDAKRVALIDVLAKEGASVVYEAQVTLAAGKHRFSAGFANDYYAPDNPDKHQRDRNLYIEQLAFAGPVGASMPSDFQRRFVEANGQKTARELVGELATRAWRRPATADEVGRLLELAPARASREEILRSALEAVLASPLFLFRIEADPADAKPGSVRDLNDYELAVRLSYFLWSSMPDDELAALAAQDKLHEDATLDAQVRRMLRDARASALTQNFAGQWLQLRNLQRASPDATRFPDFDDELRGAMRAETEMLFEAVLREERPLRELIDPDFTFVNERLARHYGIEGVTGALMRRVPLSRSWRGSRGGLLAQASMLVVTSNPTRTSPVKRGKWILENILGTPPPPPLPGVDNLDENSPAARSASLRERMAQHRNDPKCAVCHEKMDALGFALENYDAIGRWREEAQPAPSEASLQLDDANSFAGPARLKSELASSREFVDCVLRKLAVYALGRGLRPQDDLALDAALDEVMRAHSTLTDAITAVVRLDAFRRRVVVERR